MCACVRACVRACARAHTREREKRRGKKIQPILSRHTLKYTLNLYLRKTPTKTWKKEDSHPCVKPRKLTITLR